MIPVEAGGDAVLKRGKGASPSCMTCERRRRFDQRDPRQAARSKTNHQARCENVAARHDALVKASSQERLMGYFKSFVAASMFLMSAGYGCSGEAKFSKGSESVMVVKASSGFWVVKEVA